MVRRSACACGGEWLNTSVGNRLSSHWRGRVSMILDLSYADQSNGWLAGGKGLKDGQVGGSGVGGIWNDGTAK